MTQLGQLYEKEKIEYCVVKGDYKLGILDICINSFGSGNGLLCGNADKRYWCVNGAESL